MIAILKSTVLNFSTASPLNGTQAVESVLLVRDYETRLFP